MSQNTEQNVRTRDEQVEALAKMLRVGFKNGIVSRSMADGYIKEAAARGAAEERAKSGERWEFEAPDYHDQGMGCGLEDRGIHDRYRAMEYGWDQAIERCVELIPEELYTRPANVSALEARGKKLEEALRAADQFITNGVEFGFIRMPDMDTPDSALSTPGIIRAALTREGGV